MGMLAFDRMAVSYTARCIALCLCLAGLAVGAVENDRFADCRSRWIEKAEAAKPRLFSRTVSPVRLADVAADPSAFQGWGVKEGKPIGSVLSKPLSDGDSFIVDFGEHLVGTVSLSLMDFGRVVDAPVRIRFSFAEVPLELAEDSMSAQPTVSKAWYQRETITFDEVPATVRLPRRYAFRYVKIEVVGCSPHGRFGIGGISAEAVTSADVSFLKPFKSSSKLAVKIDEIACRTLRDCMQTVFEDGPKRDRRLWLGDLRLEALANYETYRNFDLVKRSLYLLAGTCNDDGLLNSDAYERPTPRKGACRILDYTALFAATLLEYLEASGDIETANDLWPLCVAQLDALRGTVGADGVFRDDGTWWCFIDWQDELNRQTAEQGALIYGFKATLRLAEKLGHGGDVAFLPEAVVRMEWAARSKLWDERRGLFVCEKERQVSYIGQAWLVLAGVLDEKTAERCLKSVLADAEAMKPVTPYANHYFTEALYAAGLRDEAERYLLAYWGEMARFGADTFWEVFVPNDHRAGPYKTPLMNSYCHAWSCAPAYFLRNAKFKSLTHAKTRW